MKALLKSVASLTARSAQSLITFRPMIFCLALTYSGHWDHADGFPVMQAGSILIAVNRCSEFSVTKLDKVIVWNAVTDLGSTLLTFSCSFGFFRASTIACFSLSETRSEKQASPIKSRTSTRDVLSFSSVQLLILGCRPPRTTPNSAASTDRSMVHHSCLVHFARLSHRSLK